jgi:hypothetical protein
MPVDRTRPLKFESASRGGTEEDDVATLMDPSEDYANVKGVVFENNEDYRLETDGAGKLGYRDTTTGGDAGTHRAFGDVSTQAEAARYTITLQSQGTIANGYFYGYSNNIPGDSTPVIIPANSTLLEFTFANSQSTADYSLLFRKNGTGVATFYTVSKTNTQFFADDTINQTFLQGDEIYVQHQTDGQNSRDVAIVLLFQVNP